MALIKQTSRMLLFTLMVTLVACTTVQPWERGNLAKPQMALDPHPIAKRLRAHNYGSREAAAGGNAAQGGRVWLLLIGRNKKA